MKCLHAACRAAFVFMFSLAGANAKGQTLMTPPVLANLDVTAVVPEGSLATLTGSITDPELNGFTVAIDWGDRSALQLVQVAAGMTSFSASHQYLGVIQPGTGFTPIAVNVTVTDADGVNNTSFLSALFQDLLGRAVDPTSQASFLSQLAAGGTRSDVAANLTSSAEYRQRLVQTLYQKLLRRAADPSGLSAGVNLLGGGATDEQFMATLLGSNEYFINRGLNNNSDFLQALYFDLLGRPIDPSAQTLYLSQLTSGTTRSQVATEILGSAEYRSDVVTTLYWRLLHRAAGSSEVSFYLNFLNTGGTDEQLINSLAGSGEYFQNRSGGTVTGQASLQVRPAPTRIVSLAMLSGVPHLVGQGLASHTYTIEVTSDLGSWDTLANVTANGAGAFTFDDTRAARLVPAILSRAVTLGLCREAFQNSC